MAVKTRWQITYSCGHQGERDLSDRAADRRAGFADWLSRQQCTDCWRSSKDEDQQDREQWLAAKREAEQAESDAWSQRYRMPPLEGTDRAVGWGVRCRHQLTSAAYTALVLEGDTAEEDWEELEEQARTVTRAGWWIDQRDADPADLPELLQAATSADRPTENPHV